MSSTSMKLPFKRFVAQVSTGEPRPKSSYIALMAENLEALKACPWREAADIPAALVDHDFRKASHFSDAYDAFKMTGVWDAKAQKEVAFAGMAAYRFAIPAAAAAVAISSVTLPISRDRFLKGGVHVAAVLDNSATPSADWSVVTGQGADGYLANDAANIVESRPADGALTITSDDLASLATTGRAYLWIYVTLEDYTDWWDQYSATEARQYAIEGSGMLVGDAAEVTFAGEVAPDAPAEEFVVASGGVYPYLAEADRAVRSYECLAAGGDLPVERLFVKQVTVSTSALYFGRVKLRDIDGDGRGIRIFASPEIYPSADMSAGRAWAISKTSTGGTDTYSVVTGNKVCNLQFFAVLGVDGRGRSSVDTLSSLNAIAPNVLFFVKYSLTSGSAAPRTMITTLSSIYNIADMLEVDTSINWNGEDSPLPDIVFDSNETDVQTIAQATLDKYLSANVARKMLAERTAESITLAVGDAATDVAAKITWTPFSMVFPLGTVGSYTFTPTFQYTKTRTCEAGFSCAVYVSGKAGVARLGVFCFPGGSNVFASTSQPENAQPSSCLKFCFDPDSGGSAAEAALYALYSRERYAMQSAIARAERVGAVVTQEWNRNTREGKWLIYAKAAMHLAEVDAQASGETLVPFRKDDDAGTLTVGNVGAVRYKGKIYGVVACWPDVASSALAYGELEEVDGRPCSFAFVVTVRSGGLHVWIPAAEAACRPDDFTQLSVSCLSDSTVGAPRIAVAGSCSVPAPAYVADLASGEIHAMDDAPDSGIVAGFVGGEIPTGSSTATRSYTESVTVKDAKGYLVLLYEAGGHRYYRGYGYKNGYPDYYGTCDPQTKAYLTAEDPGGSVVTQTVTRTYDATAKVSAFGVNATAESQSGFPGRASFFVTGNHLRRFAARLASDMPNVAPAAAESAVGLRNVYAKAMTGNWTEVPALAAMQPGASFVVRRGDVSVATTNTGTDEGATPVRMWRISATAALVPFSVPAGLSPTAARFAWDEDISGRLAPILAQRNAAADAERASRVSRALAAADVLYDTVAAAAQTAAGAANSAAASVKAAAAAALDGLDDTTYSGQKTIITAAMDNADTANAFTMLVAIEDACAAAALNLLGASDSTRDSARDTETTDAAAGSRSESDFGYSQAAAAIDAYVAALGTATTLTTANALTHARTALRGTLPSCNGAADKAAASAAVWRMYEVLADISGTNANTERANAFKATENKLKSISAGVAIAEAVEAERSAMAEAAANTAAEEVPAVTIETLSGEGCPVSFAVTEGALLNVWLKRGEYVTAIPAETLKKPEIHDATAPEVDGWELVASFPAATTGDETVRIPRTLTDRLGTFLLTAFFPPNGWNPSPIDTFPVGVGLVDANAVSGKVNDLDTGWKPDITLIG